MPDLLTTLLLILAAFGAGWIDAVVGGGGLIQLPALMIAFPSAAPAQLLATNKLGSICGTSTSSITYARRVRPELRTVAYLAIPAFAGALVGAVIASHIPRSAFNPVILVVLVAVGAYTLLRPNVGDVTALRFSGRRHYGTAGLVGFFIGMYDGALGPGTGSFLVFALVGLLGYRFLDASAKAKIANFATNLAALVIFVPQGVVLWGLGLAMGVANIAGAYLGSRMAVARGSRFIRAVFVVVVGAFIVKIGADTLRQLL
ncbi:TSUP family transporter [Calidifontibacter sp. DB0510]|uniref:Probable membrane transporter protein n=1 Tax=Metallococcus carri TaxID=1656884 RepID=A0A967AZJ1_9MICO|nr:TSUP family transporter [Metallococcus carri]NHN54628.1 TSUP family transporter [Metallococcus carri]NOP36533.1 TSUP family transporter [Calidifontibacter sp. DB2511S]